jgi:hypothetical protein
MLLFFALWVHRAMKLHQSILLLGTGRLFTSGLIAVVTNHDIHKLDSQDLLKASWDQAQPVPSYQNDSGTRNEQQLR